MRKQALANTDIRGNKILNNNRRRESSKNFIFYREFRENGKNI
jgi:hypothetical protein